MTFFFLSFSHSIAVDVSIGLVCVANGADLLADDAQRRV